MALQGVLGSFLQKELRVLLRVREVPEDLMGVLCGSQGDSCSTRRSQGSLRGTHGVSGGFQMPTDLVCRGFMGISAGLRGIHGVSVALQAVSGGSMEVPKGFMGVSRGCRRYQ